MSWLTERQMEREEFAGKIEDWLSQPYAGEPFWSRPISKERPMSTVYDDLNNITNRAGEIRLGTEQADDSLADCVRELTGVCAALLRRIEALEATTERGFGLQ